MTEAKILAFTGTTASILSMTGGWLTYGFPVLGPALMGSAGFVMLVGNVVVLFRSRAELEPEYKFRFTNEDLP